MSRITYSSIVRRGGPPNKREPPRRTSGERIEQTTPDETQRSKLGLGALAWRMKAPIGHRMLRGDAELREGPLKDNVEAMEFVYVDGMTRMRYGEARSLLRCVGVDTREIRDISFVGNSVSSLLVMKTYKEKLISKLVPEGSPLRIISNFDPLSGDHLKRPAAAGQARSPVDCFIRRAALAVVNNRKLEVATKYQEQLPAEHKDKLRMEVQRLAALRSGSKDASKAPSKSPEPSKAQEAMDTTP